jgi:signal transduction histidine kinase
MYSRQQAASASCRPNGGYAILDVVRFLCIAVEQTGIQAQRKHFPLFYPLQATLVEARMNILPDGITAADILAPVLEAITDGVLILDYAGTIEYVNPAAQELWAGALAPGMNLLAHPDLAALTRMDGAPAPLADLPWYRTLQHGEVSPPLHLILHRPGQAARYLRVSSWPILHPGRLAGVGVTLQTRHPQAEMGEELAERNHALQALNTLAARLLRLNTAAAIYDAALEGVLAIVGATQGAVALTDDAAQEFRLATHRGYSAATQQHTDHLTYDTPAAHNMVRELGDIVVIHPDRSGLVGQAVLRGEAVQTAVLMPLFQGAVISGVLSYLLDEYRECTALEREILRTASTFISAALERAQFAEQAEAQRALLEVLVAGVPVGLAFYSHDARLVNFNAAWAQMMGVDPLTARGGMMYDLAPALREREIFHQRVLAGEALDLANVPIRSPGEEAMRYYDIHYRPVRDLGGRVSAMLSAAVDVTARHELDQQKDEFLSIASHELKTPITAIKGYAQAGLRAVSQSGDERLIRTLRIIDEQANRLTRLINDLLDLASVQSGELTFVPEPFDLRRLVHEVVSSLELMAPGFTFALDLPTTPLIVHADPQRIEQVVINLVQNAIKYSGESRRVELRIWREGGEVITGVRDFGVGIPADQQAQVFAQFFRGSNVAARQYGGLGLGLFISHGILTRHGGRVWLDSVEGSGSTFYFALPLVVTEGATEG